MLFPVQTSKSYNLDMLQDRRGLVLWTRPPLSDWEQDDIYRSKCNPVQLNVESKVPYYRVADSTCVTSNQLESSDFMNDDSSAPAGCVSILLLIYFTVTCGSRNDQVVLFLLSRFTWWFCVSSLTCNTFTTLCFMKGLEWQSGTTWPDIDRMFWTGTSCRADSGGCSEACLCAGRYRSLVVTQGNSVYVSALMWVWTSTLSTGRWGCDLVNWGLWISAVWAATHTFDTH